MSPSLTPERFDAVLFDLDGVLTATAKVHAAAWKRMFDEFLRRRAEETGEPFVPFDVGSDYERYVDGKPRYACMTLATRLGAGDAEAFAQHEEQGLHPIDGVGHWVQQEKPDVVSGHLLAWLKRIAR